MANGGTGGLGEPRDWLKSSLALLSMVGFLGTIYLLSVHDIVAEIPRRNPIQKILQYLSF